MDKCDAHKTHENVAVVEFDCYIYETVIKNSVGDDRSDSGERLRALKAH